MKKLRYMIKYFSRRSILGLIAILLISSACQERLDEMNMNPNAITEVPADYLFTTAIRGTFRQGLDLLQVDFAAQHAHLAVSYDFRREIDKYEENYVGDLPQSLFSSIYGSSIKYCKDIEVLTDVDGKQENEIRHALGDVVTVMNYSKLTDLYGDVPYFQGGLGKEGEFLPEYDRQEDIYSDMIEKLGASLDILETADFSMAFPGADPMYDNNREGWLRFTNSLRLRLAMRARYADPGKYNPIIAECLAMDLIDLNVQNASLQHWDSDHGQLRNPWYRYYEERYISKIYNFNVSEMYVDFLSSTSDPRLEVMVDTNAYGDYVGMPNGLNEVEYSTFPRQDASILSLKVLAKDQYLYYMTASEVWFLRAEAALFDLGSGDPNELYQMGISQAMRQWGITQSEVDDFLTASDVGMLTGSDEEKFEQIGYQMWLAFVPNYCEAWFNMRRTGYPFIPQRTADGLSAGVTDGYMPRRIVYPLTTERSVNGENMQTAIDRMAEGDHIYSRVWWDAKE